MTEEPFDPMESLNKIAAGASYLYNKLPHKERIKLRQSMDIFADKLLIETDPMKNYREANMIITARRMKTVDA